MFEPLLNLSQVSKYYTGNQAVVVGLNSISLSFSRGEFVAITGESGSGKSTLSHVIGGILPYESGELYFEGKETSHYDSLDWERYRRDNISFISQSYGILPGATVMKNVVSALILAGMDKRKAKTEAERILKQVELWDFKRRRAAKLSSGQKQRLSIARALAKPAPILIADEPTGNLDPENSAKVISLLAQAAKDRLVILVTHEFDEAKDFATRHIVLQDGRVASDTELRPAVEPGPAPTVEKGKKRLLSPYVARLQYSSRPVWTAIMVLFFAMTAFAVFAFLGVFIINLDDTSTRIYDDSAFLNGDPLRIAVMRRDAEKFTEEDYKTILSLQYVTALEKNGYVTDMQYAYREDVDYTTKYTASTQLVGLNEEMHEVQVLKISYDMSAKSPFIKTIPMLRDGAEFLTDGRLPESFFEVVSADPDLKVGDTVAVFLSDRKGWRIGEKVLREFTVVGTTDFGSGLYFHEDVGFMMRMGALSESGKFFIPDNSLGDGVFRGSSEVYPELKDVAADEIVLPDDLWEEYFDFFMEYLNSEHAEGSDEYHSFSTNFLFVTGVDQIYYISIDHFTIFNMPEDNDDILVTSNDEDAWLWLKNSEVHTDEPEEPEEGGKLITDYEPKKLVYVSPRNFHIITDKSESDQISITIEGYGYTDRVISALRKLGYTAVSPYQLGSTQQDPELADKRMHTLRVCLIALIAIVALQTVLLRALFGMQTESYKLLSNIGLTSPVAKLSIWWQVIAFTIAGQLLGGAGIVICAQAGIERIKEITTYLPAAYVAILCGVHLAVSAISAIWIVAALGKQVYPLSRKHDDLVLTGESRA